MQPGVEEGPSANLSVFSHLEAFEFGCLKLTDAAPANASTDRLLSKTFLVTTEHLGLTSRDLLAFPATGPSPGWRRGLIWGLGLGPLTCLSPESASPSPAPDLISSHLESRLSACQVQSHHKRSFLQISCVFPDVCRAFSLAREYPPYL